MNQRMNGKRHTVCINVDTLPVLSYLFFNPSRIAFAPGNASASAFKLTISRPNSKAESETPDPLTKENTTSASPASLSSTSKSSYDPTTGRTPNPLSFSPFSAVRTRAEIWKEPEVKEGWMRSRERTEPPMYPTQNRLFQDWSGFFLRREYYTGSTGYEDVEFGLGGH